MSLLAMLPRLRARRGLARFLAAALLLVGTARHGAAQAAPSAKPELPRIDILEMLNDQLADVVGTARETIVSIKGRIRRSGVDVRLFGTHRSDLPPAPPSAPHVPITGSGFLLPGGIVVTTAEVVSGISTPSIVLPNGRSVRATAMGCDERSNIAILKIKTKNMEVGLHWGDSAKLRPGYLAITIGNQSGFANSATLGMISALDQKGIATTAGRHYDSLLLFQGAVGVGSIGSPLLNLRGEVIGMVVAAMIGPGLDAGGARLLLPTGSNMGFALPASAIRDQQETILQNARKLPETGWFGIGVDKHRAPGEVLITHIYIDSPADRAGVQPGDIITEIDDEPIHSEADLQRVSEQLSAGQKVRIELKRGDRPLSKQLEITPKPDDAKQWKIRWLPEHIGALPDDLMFDHPIG